MFPVIIPSFVKTTYKNSTYHYSAVAVNSKNSVVRRTPVALESCRHAMAQVSLDSPSITLLNVLLQPQSTSSLFPVPERWRWEPFSLPSPCYAFLTRSLVYKILSCTLRAFHSLRKWPAANVKSSSKPHSSRSSITVCLQHALPAGRR